MGRALPSRYVGLTLTPTLPLTLTLTLTPTLTMTLTPTLPLKVGRPPARGGAPTQYRGAEARLHHTAALRLD